MLVEQNATMALKVCDYVYLLETGVVKVQGIAEEVWSREDVKFIWEDKYVFSGLFITADHEWSSFLRLYLRSFSFRNDSSLWYPATHQFCPWRI